MTEARVAIGEFSLLEVVTVNSLGAFLSWGSAKDLFLPFAEQVGSVRAGQWVIVFPYIDKSERVSASMRLDKNIAKEPPSYQEGEAVSLMITAETDLGLKVIVDNRYWGVVYRDEVFSEMSYGQKVQGYIKKIRPDGKLDVSFQKLGHKAGQDIEPKILAHLEKSGGFCNLTDKTPAETIYELFGVSKKKYKIALGGLYKKRLIAVQEDGICLVRSGQAPKRETK